MTIWNVFGDSISQTTSYNGASNPATTSYVPVLAAATGLTVSNNAVSGSEAGDQASAVFSVTPNSSFLSSFFIGVNDNRHWGANPVNLAVFESCVLAEAIWLAVNNSDLVLASGPHVTYSGGMGSNVAPVYGSLPRWTDTMGESVTFTLKGNSLYVCTIQQGGDPGQETITVDGIVQGTWNVSPASSISTYLGVDYMPKCYHLYVGGTPADNHTVVVSKSNATAYASRVYFMFGWGNGMLSSPSPKLLLAGPPPCTAAGYAASAISPAVPDVASTQAYDAAVASVASALSADGLNVELVNLFPALFPGTDTDVGGVHPDDAGHALIARTFWAGLVADGEA